MQSAPSSLSGWPSPSRFICVFSVSDRPAARSASRVQNSWKWAGMYHDPAHVRGGSHCPYGEGGGLTALAMQVRFRSRSVTLLTATW